MRLTKLSLACLVLGGSALLTACGGGGGGSALTVQGTAATGAPMVGTVFASCKAGTGTAVSNLDGRYSVVVSNGVGPCLLAITPTGGAKLYSVTSGSGATQTANITPMTNLLVSYLRNVPGMTASEAEAWFSRRNVLPLLENPRALTERIDNDFVPALKKLLPSLSVANADFLFTPFIASPTSSATDADLEKLKTAGIVTATGEPSPTTTKLLADAASDDTPVVAPTGAGI